VEEPYILGSAIEAALLVAIVYYAWTWPKQTHPPRRPVARDAHAGVVG
jgi:hypothetical protein